MTIIRPLQVETPGDAERVVITRTFDAPRALVFECHTKAELVSRWLIGPPGWTMPVCELDFRVGGRFRYVWRKEDGAEFGVGGTFREIATPARIVHTELFDEDWTGGETTVTQVFAEDGGLTTLTMTVVYSSREARVAALATGMTEGMEQSYQALDGQLAAAPEERHGAA